MATATLTATRTEQLRLPMRTAPRKERSRSDSLPETTRYRDDGCEVSPACLSCPLPRCRYEEPGGLRAILNEVRDEQIMALREQGYSVDALAQRFDVSRRTVFRIIGSESSEARERARRRKAREDFEPIPIRRHQRPESIDDLRREANCA